MPPASCSCPGAGTTVVLSVSFQFRTWNSAGLLLFSSLVDGTVELALNEGKVNAHINATQKRSTRIDISSGESCSFTVTEWRVLLSTVPERRSFLCRDLEPKCVSMMVHTYLLEFRSARACMYKDSKSRSADLRSV
ncbi:hypothetical protein AAFF_G00361290 [Aldrovandia affinis]|uniref:Uncharacterized protein n=1 Tax=Aldrovandia affinis TaxID=143900 RepID=A0AAD7VZ70_9TELE|nr:hypothetical protein AAFF_G00361290 [Aldrovandia affinis]